MTYRKRTAGGTILSAVLVAPTAVLGQLPVGGGPPESSENLVLNPSFEDGFKHWSLTLAARETGEEIRSTVDVDPTVAHTGHASVRINGNDDTTLWVAAKSAPVAVRSETQYILSAWVKTDRVNCAFDQYRNSNAYVQFLDSEGKIVPQEGSPVRATPTAFGTIDWQRVYRVITSPPGAVSAVVGIALTCTGTAWFDDVQLGSMHDVEWKEQTTARFEYFYEESDGPSDDVVKDNRTFLESLERVLGVRHADRIRYYKYASVARKRELTQDGSSGHYSGDTIHSVRWDSINLFPGVLMATVGESTSFLANGIASYSLSLVRGTSPHRGAKQMLGESMFQSAVALNGPEWADEKPTPWMQNLSTSFVGYLCEQYGMEKFKKFYAFESPEQAAEQLSSRAVAVYGRPLEALDREWQEFLKHLD